MADPMRVLDGTPVSAALWFITGESTAAAGLGRCGRRPGTTRPSPRSRRLGGFDLAPHPAFLVVLGDERGAIELGDVTLR